MAESAAREQQGQAVNGLRQSASEDRADALIAAYMTITSDDTEHVAREYQISPDAVEAIRAFYHRHQESIDDCLAANCAY